MSEWRVQHRGATQPGWAAPPAYSSPSHVFAKSGATAEVCRMSPRVIAGYTEQSEELKSYFHCTIKTCEGGKAAPGPGGEHPALAPPCSVLPGLSPGKHRIEITIGPGHCSHTGQGSLGERPLCPHCPAGPWFLPWLCSCLGGGSGPVSHQSSEVWGWPVPVGSPGPGLQPGACQFSTGPERAWGSSAGLFVAALCLQHPLLVNWAGPLPATYQEGMSPCAAGAQGPTAAWDVCGGRFGPS